MKDSNYYLIKLLENLQLIKKLDVPIIKKEDNLIIDGYYIVNCRECNKHLQKKIFTTKSICSSCTYKLNLRRLK